jgi:TolB protein
VVNLNSSGLIKLNKGFSVNGGAAWSPDGKQIVFRDDTGKGKKLFIIRVDGTGRKHLTDRKDYDDGFPLFSPDGKLILFTSSNAKLAKGDFPISVVPTDGSNPAVLTVEKTALQCI